LDKATLVRTDLDFVGIVVSALRKARIPVTLIDWTFVPQLDEWQLVIATPWYDTRGPHEAFSKVVAALQKEGTYEEVPIRRLFVKSPNDSLVRELEREIKMKTEGVIFIDDYGKQGNRKLYSVVFAPFTGPGGAMPAKRISGDDELRDFLTNKLHVHRSQAEGTLEELEHRRNAWIPNIQLTKREAKILGLA
jgi:hypothetical protein